MPIKTFNSIDISIIKVKQLTPESFAEFGGVISSFHQLNSIKSTSANYGTAIKLFKVSPIENKYTESSSKVPAEANFNLFRCSPPNHLIRASLDGNSNIYNMKVLEQHPYSTQTFIPMGIDKNLVCYMVIVAKTASDGLPDPNTIEAFIAKGNQAVTYGVGIWHCPMIALNETVDFAVLIHENGVVEDDCREVYFEPGVPVEFPLVTSTSDLSTS